ncbi:PAS domain-containing sensor histidine kinase [Uliginosibacterium aquaticum]|uniref:histidine kinase n=1 Tax=Uliginosibacterium aquaticum TaxID=2731212 RepID=A0ABX2IG34_9RHOO|nr:PAS domain-containing sensor histidine kinase [Uliginosibacterium aquaticum]NSL54808.1 PAS domain-containing sensor histidine kinase [Uliginosibacterium aquaticum]
MQLSSQRRNRLRFLLAFGLVVALGLLLAAWQGMRGQALQHWQSLLQARVENHSEGLLGSLERAWLQLKPIEVLYAGSELVTRAELEEALRRITDSPEAALQNPYVALVLPRSGGAWLIEDGNAWAGSYMRVGRRFDADSAMARSLTEVLRSGRPQVVLEAGVGNDWLLYFASRIDERGGGRALLYEIPLGNVLRHRILDAEDEGLRMRLQVQPAVQPDGYQDKDFPVIATPGVGLAPALKIEQRLQAYQAEWIFEWDALPLALGGPQYALADLTLGGGVLSLILLGLLLVMSLRWGERNSRLAAERALTLSELSRSEARYRTLLAQLPCLVLRCANDPQWTMEFMSARCLSITGYPPEALIGNRDQAYADLIVAEDVERVASEVARALDLHLDYELKYRIRRADGVVRWVHERGAASYDENGQVQWIDALVFDVTDAQQISEELARSEEALRALNLELELRVQRRTGELEQSNRDLQRAMEQLVQAEKMASLGSLVAGVAHELNTPIGSALVVASTLKEKSVLLDGAINAGELRKSQLADYVETVREASAMLEGLLVKSGELISSFKEVAIDQQSMRRRKFRLAEVAREILATLHSQLRHSPVRVELNVPEDISLDSYPGPLGQVLSNLVGNAVLHGFTGRKEGGVRVEACLLDADTVELKVSDDGCGMTEHVQHHAFDPFFTTRLGQGGNGLGLYICYGIVSGVLGGSITLESRPGAGTTFIIRLPRVGPLRTEEALQALPTISSATASASSMPSTAADMMPPA